jgi:hypothetical protein
MSDCCSLTRSRDCTSGINAWLEICPKSRIRSQSNPVFITRKAFFVDGFAACDVCILATKQEVHSNEMGACVTPPA